MKNYKSKLLILIVLLTGGQTYAQNRIKDNNSIGWYNYFGTFKLNDKWGIHTEYQLRRENLITDRQQNLLRTGINYQLSPKVQLRAGYALIETFNYGAIPINGMGKAFTEHRAYQMTTITDKISMIDFSHRFMLEQRWVGRYSNADLDKEDDYVYLNRARYMLRIQMPLKGKTIVDHTPYFAAYNEVFIGFGKNVGENVFDQNRIGLLLGYKLDNTFRIEAGYLNQTKQLGREVNNQNVFQYNNGLIINSYFNFDLSKKQKN
jgi:hypothetical protein